MRICQLGDAFPIVTHVISDANTYAEIGAMPDAVGVHNPKPDLPTQKIGLVSLPKVSVALLEES